MTVRTLNPAETADLAAWRVLALRRMPYMASILFKVVPLSSDELPTLAVDKRWRLYINYEWARTQTPEMIGQVLCHEASHLLGNHSHFAEQMGVTPDKYAIWNIAADCAINDDLRDAGCKEMTEFGMLPGKIGCEDYQTPQVYYRHLEKQQEASGGDGGGMPGDGGETCGSGSGGAPAPGELGGEADTAEGDTNGSSAGVGEVEAEVARLGTAQAIKNQAALRPGSVPGGMLDMADQIMKPTPIPWQQILSANVRRYVAFKRGRSNYSYKRVNRRLHNVQLTRPDGSRLGKVMFPGTVSPKVRIAYIRDTSGSMSNDQLGQVNAEVEGIASKCGIRGDELLVMDADTKVHTVKGYKGRASTVQVTGRGGTAMDAAIEWVWEQKHRPAVIVVATDGETAWPAEPGPTPVVALIVTEDGSKPRWGGEPPEWITSIYVAVSR